MRPSDLATRFPLLAFLSLLTVLGIITGCHPKSNLLNQHSRIDYATFSSAPVAVGGMVSIVGSAESRAKGMEAHSNRLESMMLSERKDLTVIPVGRVHALLGDPSYGDLLRHFESYGELDPISLARMDSVIGSQARFLLLGRITEANVSRDEVETDPDYDPKTHDEETQRRTTLTVRAGFQVYDLQSQGLVWSADVQNSACNTQNKNKYDKSDLIGLVGFVADIVKSDEAKYPPAPGLESVLTGICDQMCERLPKPAKKKK